MSTDALYSRLDLAMVLVHVARARGAGIERLRAEQLLAESRRAWPGEPATMWTKWLSEAVRSLGLRGQVVALPIEDALKLAQDGALLVGGLARDGSATIVFGFDGRHAEIELPDTQQREKILARDLERIVGSDGERDGTGTAEHPCWLIVEDLELDHDRRHAFHHRPIGRLLALLRPERTDIYVVAVFAFFAGVLGLATPIAVESLVNMVAFGGLLQPLLILSLLLFAFLGFAAIMRALQAFVVEIIQRRLFVRVAADLAYRFPRVPCDSLNGHYGPELANRFFDIVTLQKVVAQLLLDGVAIALGTVIGMTVLAFYHPWLLGFDVLLLMLVVGGIVILGRGAITSGIDESRQKYRLAAWLEDLLRCPVAFKYAGAAEFGLDRANEFTVYYLDARQAHFRILFRQLLFVLGLQAVAGTVLLGIGGWLVIQGQLTLGQLVAAELIVATILGSMAKLGKHLEGFYDVVAAVDKLGHLFDLEIEPQDGLQGLPPGGGIQIRVTDVERNDLGGPSRLKCSLRIEANERLALLADGGAGSTTLFDYLFVLQYPKSGHVEIEHTDPRDVRPDALRRSVALVRDVEVFEGTIAENIHLGRADISMTDVRAALYDVGILEVVLRLPEGIDTPLNGSGQPLQATQRVLLMLARAVAGKPRLLLVDGALDVLSDSQLSHMCELFRQPSREWTVLVATNRGEVAEHFERIIDLDRDPESNPADQDTTFGNTESLS